MLSKKIIKFSSREQGGNLENFDYSTMMSNLQSGDWSKLLPVLLPIMGIMFVFGIILYVYSALVLQAIAKKLNHKSPWMAWIPIANVVLLWQISGTPQWTIICYFAGFVLAAIPLLGGLLALGAAAIAVYWWWIICEKLNRDGWWSLISIIFFPAWLVMLGIMAWSDAPAKPQAPVAPTPQA